MNLVGSLLISALLVFPAISAMRLAGSFRSVILLSAVISVCCTVGGILCAIVLNTPVGATIVILNIVLFLLFTLIGHLRGGN